SLKTKTRSKSSPYPTSALDFIPVTSSDVFQPLPLIIRNYFDLILPRELRLAILRSLIHVHEADLQRAIEEGRFNMAKAASSRGRWVGRDKGIRELFKLSRVSRGWRDLVFDGELWSELDLHSFPGLPPALIAQLTQRAGSFIRRLDLSGHIQLLPDSLTNIANDMCLSTVSEMDLGAPFTQLTTIKLQGCTALTTRSLHHLLVRCKNLETLSVKGMSAVTNVTCDIIANFCPRVVSLNMSRCPNMDAEGIRALSNAALMREEHLALKELRVSGLKHVTDSMMRLLGRAAPFLQVLDLSYSRQVHNSTIEALVACDDLHNRDGAGADGGQWKSKLDDLGVATVLVSARDLGREPNDTGKFRRRVTRLRHLVLSSCILLSDVACSNLAFSVPELEFLELAGIGPDLKDEGLIRLLSTTPKIRRLDLEDATDITNAVLSTLTPGADEQWNSASRSGPENTKENQQPGHALEHLTVSYAENLTDVGILRLIKACKKLRVLEADNTHVGSAVLKQFIKIARERKAADAKIVAIDCRGISESLVKDLSSQTRPRLGWRAYGARKLMYLDAQDDCEDELKIGQDECDPLRVVVKSFYSWQTVDAVKAVKEKRRKQSARRMGSENSLNTGDDGDMLPSVRAARWWSPGGRRAMRTPTPGRTSPPLLPDLASSDGCRTM
ncbi:RNI-like protein, partial [Panaeolus papilionaceus]